MCGIWAYVYGNGSTQSVEPPLQSTLKNRGPDTTNTIFNDPYFRMVFYRLSINGLDAASDQPFIKNNIYIMCNGEIYNYKKIAQQHKYEMSTQSDCEVLCHLFMEFWDNPKYIFQTLHGEYAIVAVRLLENGTTSIIAGRDQFGVRPLYWSAYNGGYIFSSLLSGIYGTGQHFPPGCYMKDSIIERFHAPLIGNCSESIPNQIRERVAQSFIDAVADRVNNTDRSIGFLLSGGLDSSLVVAVAKKILGVSPKTFSIGTTGSTDLLYARQVAEYLGTDHTEVIFTLDQAIDVIPEVIKCLETYDITTIRASIGSFLLAKHITQYTDIKVILNGDGSDEVACGYLYNYYAPSPEEATYDALRLLKEIHMYDGLRVDRTLSYHGLEARVPFLDPRYVSAYLDVPASLRVPSEKSMEKLFLRDTFSTLYPGILPKEVLYRRKEAFSDGVSAKVDTGKETMIQRIKSWASSHNTSEPEIYKKIFLELFPNHLHILPKYWMPQWIDVGETNDPSATTLKIY